MSASGKSPSTVLPLHYLRERGRIASHARLYKRFINGLAVLRAIGKMYQDGNLCGEGKFLEVLYNLLLALSAIDSRSRLCITADTWDIQPFVRQTKFKSRPKNYSVKSRLLNGAPVFRFCFTTFYKQKSQCPWCEMQRVQRHGYVRCAHRIRHGKQPYYSVLAIVCSATNIIEFTSMAL